MFCDLDASKELRNETELSVEIELQNAHHLKNHKIFQVFFLLNDATQSVEVVEIPEIDLEEVIAWVKMGGSIFIKNKGCAEI